MKSLTLFSTFFRTLLGASAAMILVFDSSAGFIDVLRGETSPEPIPIQRVAFFGSAYTKSVEGHVERLAGIEYWQPLRAGDELMPGDLIRTKNGTAILLMSETQSFVKVTPNTLLRLAEPEQTSDRDSLTRDDRKGYVVRSCRGKAFSRVDGSKWKRIRVDSVLPEDAAVRTEAESFVDLFHIETRRPIRIAERSEVILPLASPTIAATKPRFAAVGSR